MLLEAAITDTIPVSTDVTFVVKFLKGDTLFMMFAILESAFVAMLFHKRDEDLTPKWFQRMYKRWLERAGLWHAHDVEAAFSFLKTDNEALESHVLNRGMAEREPTIALIAEEEESEGSESKPETPPSEQRKPINLTRMDSLSEWLERIGYEQYDSAFRKMGINTLPELVESRLNESDLEVDVGVTGILARRRLLAHLNALSGHTMLKQDPLHGVVSQLRTGLVGHEDVMLNTYGAAELTTKRGAGGLVVDDGKAAAFAEAEQLKREEKLEKMMALEKARAIHDYWVKRARWTDLVAQAVFPLAYLVYVCTSLA